MIETFVKLGFHDLPYENYVLRCHEISEYGIRKTTNFDFSWPSPTLEVHRAAQQTMCQRRSLQGGPWQLANGVGALLTDASG